MKVRVRGVWILGRVWANFVNFFPKLISLILVHVAQLQSPIGLTDCISVPHSAVMHNWVDELDHFIGKFHVSLSYMT